MITPDRFKIWSGISEGHWEVDTLIVETTGFKQAMWIDGDGTPLPAAGKLITRIRKVDNGDRNPFLEVITTIDDPAYYTRPWSIVRTFGWGSNQMRFNKYNCEQQIGDASDHSNAGLVVEPRD